MGVEIMKAISAVLLSLVFIFLLTCPANAETFKPENYTEVDKEKIKAMPEEYKNKKIWYESIYFGYEITFPRYVEKSGFKAGKDFCLLVRPVILPVMAEKTKEMNDLVPTLKRGTKVKVYGRMKKFMSEPEKTVLPHYYLELDKMEIVEEAVKPEKRNRPDDNNKQQPDEDEKSPWKNLGGLNIGPPRNPQQQ